MRIRRQAGRQAEEEESPKMKVECVLGVMMVVLGLAMAAKRCKECDPEKCPVLNAANCLAGTAKDDCGCCDVCATLEGQPCNLK